MWFLFFATLIFSGLWWSFLAWYKKQRLRTRIVGNGVFSVQINAAGKHILNLKKLCGRRTADCINRKTEACLTIENNNLEKYAVRVTIQGYTVGYLPCASAINLRHALINAGLSKVKLLECAANIRGTWDAGQREQGNFGVWLDLPK